MGELTTFFPMLMVCRSRSMILNMQGVPGKSINFNGGTGWWVSSDIKLKKDIRDAEPMMDRLMQVPVRRFKWKSLPMIRYMTWA